MFFCCHRKITALRMCQFFGPGSQSNLQHKRHIILDGDIYGVLLWMDDVKYFSPQKKLILAVQCLLVPGR